MNLAMRNIVALIVVVALFHAFQKTTGRLAYEGLDLNDGISVAFAVAVPVIAAVSANYKAFASLGSTPIKVAARGGAILLATAIFASVGLLVFIQF